MRKAALLCLTTAATLVTSLSGTALASAPDGVSSGNPGFSLYAENDTLSGVGYVLITAPKGSSIVYVQASLGNIVTSGADTIETERQVSATVPSRSTLVVSPNLAGAVLNTVQVSVTTRTCVNPWLEVHTCTETTDVEPLSLTATAAGPLVRQAGSYVTDSSAGKTIRAGMSTSRSIQVNATLGDTTWTAVDDGFVTGMAVMGTGVSNNVERYDYS